MKQLFSVLAKPSADALASKELDEARRALLGHQTGSEYHAAMIKFYEIKIARLTKMLSQRGAA